MVRGVTAFLSCQTSPFVQMVRCLHCAMRRDFFLLSIIQRKSSISLDTRVRSMFNVPSTSATMERLLVTLLQMPITQVATSRLYRQRVQALLRAQVPASAQPEISLSTREAGYIASIVALQEDCNTAQLT